MRTFSSLLPWLKQVYTDERHALSKYIKHEICHIQWNTEGWPNEEEKKVVEFTNIDFKDTEI